MIIDYVLNNCTWTPYGVTCPDANTTLIVHKFLREAILDRHIYVCKVIGFEMHSPVAIRPHVGTYIARNVLVADSYPEIMVNIQNMFFLHNKSCVARSALYAGPIYSDNTDFVVDGRDCLKAINSDPYMMRVLDKHILLNLQISYDCGYRGPAKNSKTLDKQFFPCCTDFYVGDYFRVLPPTFGSKEIRINYYSNCTPDNLRTLLENWSNLVKARDIRKEELTWVQSFGL